MKNISSLQHPLVRYWQRLKEDGSFRRTEKRVLLEGRNCIEDVSQPIKRLLALSEELIPEDLVADEVVIITEQILKKISSVEQSSGLVAELALPEMKQLQGSRLIACDRVQDPGNLGTLIRTACAFGWDGLFLLPGCVDPFNDKAIRAAKGATFCLPLMKGSWQELEAIAQENVLEIVVADVAGEPPEKFAKNMKKLLILGNEAQGVKLPQDISYRKVTLTMPGSVDSLNVAVAGSILMYLL